MKDANRFSKLTEREKEVLRLWLERKTAKEIAIELGVSHHAVEKRLKMARFKLGVASSLEAARILSEEERYQRAGAHPPDVPIRRTTAQGNGSQIKLTGAAIMITFALATLALAAQSTSSAETYGALPDSGVGENVGFKGVLDKDMIRPTEAQIDVITRATFDFIDEDKSSFLEGLESPVGAPSEKRLMPTKDENGNVTGREMRLMTPKEATDGFYNLADKDRDGRVSYAEFRAWSRPTLLRIGIPKIWVTDLESALVP